MSRDSKVLVALHAYPLSGAQWDGLAEDLREWKIIAPDLPGFGTAPAGPSTLDEFADAVMEAIDASGVDRFVLLGLSMGGYVAFRVLKRWPSRVAGLILADTRAGADSPAARDKRTEQAERARREGVGWLPDAFLPDALGDTTRREAPEVVDHVRGMVEAADAEGVARALLAMRDRPDSRPDLSSVTVPTLVIVGEEDRLTPLEEAEAIQRGIPGARLTVIPRAGHLSNLESPAAFSGAIRSFLEDFS